LEQVDKIKNVLQYLGVRKIQFMLRDILKDKGYKIGRDQLYDLLRRNNGLTKKGRPYRSTTNSKHKLKIYPNLLPDITIDHPNQVLVSDITYLVTQEGFCYLALTTDAFSRKIVGYNLSHRMKTELPLQALKDVCDKFDIPPGFIHHSDKGSQYCSKEFTEFLTSKGASISMTGPNHCFDNALAERVNGILKTEFGLGKVIKDFKTALKLVKDSIELYNSLRPHLSLKYKTPDAVYFEALANHAA